MDPNRSVKRYRRWYARLLRLYPAPYRERFGEGMEQTFADLCREHGHAGLPGYALWLFAETSAGIIKENLTHISMYKNIKKIAVVVVLILLVPLAGNLARMAYGIGSWDWSFGDFIVMGALLFAAGLAVDFAIRTVKSPILRILAVIGILLALLAVWAELAVDAVSQFLRL